MNKTQSACIRHAHLWGLREGNNGKYEFPKNHTVLNTKWDSLITENPFYLLIPKNADL